MNLMQLFGVGLQVISARTAGGVSAIGLVVRAIRREVTAGTAVLPYRTRSEALLPAPGATQSCHAMERRLPACPVWRSHTERSAGIPAGPPRNNRRENQRGTALIFALAVLVILSIGTSALWSQLHSNLQQQRIAWHQEQAFHLAEAGLEKAVAMLRTGSDAYQGETQTELGPGHFTVTVQPGAEPNSFVIESRGVLDNAAYHYDRARLRARLRLAPNGQVRAYAWESVRGDAP